MWVEVVVREGENICSAHGCHSRLAASRVALSFLGLLQKTDLLAKSTNPAPVEAPAVRALLCRRLILLVSIRSGR